MRQSDLKTIGAGARKVYIFEVISEGVTKSAYTGTGVYKWPLELAADIAVKALLTSTFDQTLMCVMDEATRVVYQGVLDCQR